MASVLGKRKLSEPEVLSKERVLRCLFRHSCPEGATDVSTFDALAALIVEYGTEATHQVLLSEPVLALLGTDLYYDLHATGLLPFRHFLQAASVDKVIIYRCPMPQRIL